MNIRQRAVEATSVNQTAVDAQAQDVIRRLEDLYNQEGTESWSQIRAMKWAILWKKAAVSTVLRKVCKTVDKIAELKERYKRIRIADRSSVFNTNVLYTVELGYILDVAQSIANSAIERKDLVVRINV